MGMFYLTHPMSWVGCDAFALWYSYSEMAASSREKTMTVKYFHSLQNGVSPFRRNSNNV